MVAISKAVADSVVRDGSGRPRIIFNGTDTSVFRPGKPDHDRFRELGLPLESGPIVGVISRIVPGKRLNLLPRLAAAVLARRPDARFLVCGAPDDPDEFGRIQSELVAAGIARSVVFAGHRDDLPELLHGFSVLAHLIVLEGFGLAVTEAMASGVPPVVFGGGGPAEVVEHGSTGFVVDSPDDIDAMAGHILDLLKAPETASSMGARARKAIESRFSVERFVAEFDDLFTSLARSRQ
jgi:glycosyltransferase involved in cell wall biosynthesis